MIGDVTIGQWP